MLRLCLKLLSLTRSKSSSLSNLLLLLPPTRRGWGEHEGICTFGMRTKRRLNGIHLCLAFRPLHSMNYPRCHARRYDTTTSRCSSTAQRLSSEELCAASPTGSQSQFPWVGAGHKIETSGLQTARS
jgi:hypothetical protein